MNYNIIYAHLSSDENDCSKQLVKESYDYCISYTDYSNDKNIYQNIYDKYSQFTANDKIITVSDNIALSMPTISFKDDTIIIIIDSEPRLNLKSSDLCQSIYASITGLNKNTPMRIPKYINTNQLIYIGLEYIDDEQQFILDEQNIKYFTMKQIRKTGMNNIINHVLKVCSGKQIQLIVNCKQISNLSSDKALFDSFCTLFTSFNNMITKLNIVNHCIKNESDIKITKIIKHIIVSTMNVKQKRVNVFTEDSNFLIYRPMDQENEDDLGWYIVRFLTADERERVLCALNDVDMISITVDDEDYYIASTNMNDQEAMSYYACDEITDKCLFPQEKTLMLFELLNC